MTHGTRSGYNGGCRCRQCTTANTDASRARRERIAGHEAPARFAGTTALSEDNPRPAASRSLGVLRPETSPPSSMGGFFRPPPTLILPAGPSHPGAPARPTFSWYRRYKAPPKADPQARSDDWQALGFARGLPVRPFSQP
jgi:hypothetical protein